MILIQGKGVSKGVANGPIYFFQRPNTTITDAPAADIETEKQRIAAAQEKAADIKDVTLRILNNLMEC